VKFIQRMPVTKVVNQVTIGDIGQATGCTTPTRTRLYVREHVGDPVMGGDFYTSQQITYSNGYVALPSSPGKVTYTIPPTTFRAGRGYSFVISENYSSTDCNVGRQTTWAHNDPQVNAGPALCTGAPKHKRMWHVGGLDDANAFCVTRPPGSRTFDPSMPTGWLVSRSPISYWDMMSGTYPSDQAIPSTACWTSGGSNPLAFGAGAVFWRVHPDSEGDSNQYTCRWSQFADHGQTVEGGWYYAQPWLAERIAALRDMYLKLDTIDYDSLLPSRAPIVAYDTNELFRVISPSATTDFYDSSDDPDDPDDANRLVDGTGAFASANPAIASSQGIDVLGTAYLGDSYAAGVGRRAGTGASGGDYLSERGSSAIGYEQDASAMEALPGYGNRVYGRVVHDSDGRIWLQYWIYYYFDPQENFLGSGEHEGDWESVQVRLDASTTPDLAAYAQHGDGEACGWNAVTKTDGHPVVYVALDSHASYFRAGDYGDPDPDDSADGAGGTVQPAVIQVGEEDTDWVRWPGRWGDSAASPDGPAFQGSKWNDPGTWANGLRPCDVS
jgi:hypothetical protein